MNILSLPHKKRIYPKKQAWGKKTKKRSQNTSRLIIHTAYPHRVIHVIHIVIHKACVFGRFDVDNFLDNCVYSKIQIPHHMRIIIHVLVYNKHMHSIKLAGEYKSCYH